ncbi:hypothetical protein [Lysobacter gummosus]|uniref:hypothetical protein n=1 Tax=Lysobacter gummosus TaxID=262324 RepID=UPI003626209D
MSFGSKNVVPCSMAQGAGACNRGVREAAQGGLPRPRGIFAAPAPDPPPGPHGRQKPFESALKRAIVKAAGRAGSVPDR